MIEKLGNDKQNKRKIFSHNNILWNSIASCIYIIIYYGVYNIILGYNIIPLYYVIIHYYVKHYDIIL